MSHVTSHILDTTKGKPAAGIRVILYQLEGEDWISIGTNLTNENGRVSLLNDDRVLQTGTYKLKYLTREYCTRSGVPAFYPFIEITFELAGDEHYHIPLLLNTFGYTTYRGS